MSFHTPHTRINPIVSDFIFLTEMASFSLPPIHDNSDGSWGPSSSNLPETFKFKDIPYAPYSKSDKLGRFADWNDISGDNRQAASGAAVNPRAGARGRRDAVQAFGSGLPSAFAFQVEDESSFSLVDNKTGAPRRGGAFGGRGRGSNRGATNSRAPQRGGRGGFTSNNRGTAQRGGRRGWRDWDKVSSCRIYRRILCPILSPRTTALASPQ